MTGGIEW